MQSVNIEYRDKHHRCRWCVYGKYCGFDLPHTPDYWYCTLKKKILKDWRCETIGGFRCKGYKADYSDLQNI